MEEYWELCRLLQWGSCCDCLAIQSCSQGEHSFSHSNGLGRIPFGGAPHNMDLFVQVYSTVFFTGGFEEL